MLNLILPALYIAPLLAVLFLERKKTHRGPALGAGDVRFYRQPDHSPPDVPALGSGRGQGDPHPVPYSYEEFLYRGRKEKFAGCVFLPFAPLM